MQPEAANEAEVEPEPDGAPLEAKFTAEVKGPTEADLVDSSSSCLGDSSSSDLVDSSSSDLADSSSSSRLLRGEVCRSLDGTAFSVCAPSTEAPDLRCCPDISASEGVAGDTEMMMLSAMVV